mgnify:CR=1 FL=1
MGENDWYISDVKVENIISDKDSDTIIANKCSYTLAHSLKK